MQPSLIPAPPASTMKPMPTVRSSTKRRSVAVVVLRRRAPLIVKHFHGSWDDRGQFIRCSGQWQGSMKEDASSHPDAESAPHHHSAGKIHKCTAGNAHNGNGNVHKRTAGNAHINVLPTRTCTVPPMHTVPAHNGRPFKAYFANITA